MGKLPRNPIISNDTNESELGSRYIDPFLCGLFDDPENGMYLRWTNEITLDARKNDGLAARWPDICITSLCGSRFSTNHGFGEVKSAAYESNHFLLCKDLLLVATFFCKDVLDTHNMEAVLGIQAIGRDIYFYILLLPANGVYVFHELGKVLIPNNLQDLTKLVMDAPLFLLIIDVFERLCIPSAHVRNIDRHSAMSIFDYYNCLIYINTLMPQIKKILVSLSDLFPFLPIFIISQ